VRRLVRLSVLGSVFSVALLSAVGAFGSGSRSAAAIPAFTPAQLSAQPADNWILENGNIQSNRYSSLSQINGSNGSSLKLAWTTHLASPATPENNIGGKVNPIVYNGVMYVQDGWARITAIDAASGKILWQFDPQVGLNTFAAGSANSIGMGDGMIFTGAYGTMYALNAQTGAQVWANQIANPVGGNGIDVSPVYYKGLVIVGTTGGDQGGSCFEVGLDAKTGSVKWHYSNIPSNPKAFGWNTWPSTRYFYGGGAVWDMPAVDPKYDLVYVGTGNPLPFNGLINGPGAEYGSDSVYALHALTGKFAWMFQEIHHDIWDYDSMETPLVETISSGGKQLDVVTHINKSGNDFILDAQTGKPVVPVKELPVPQDPLSHTYPTQPQSAGDLIVPHGVQDPQNWTGVVAPDGKPYKIDTGIFGVYNDSQFIVISPTAGGGVEWPDPSFSAKTGYEYVCANILDMALKAPPAADQHPVINNAGAIIQWDVASVPNQLSVSRLDAFNPANNKTVWQHDDTTTGGFANGNPTGPCDSPVTTTGGGLVLIGRIVATPQAPNGEAFIQAYDDMNGKLLWQVPVLVNGKIVPVDPRISVYAVNGKEYIATMTHFGPAGPDISAFALP